jgi:exosortase A
MNTAPAAAVWSTAWWVRIALVVSLLAVAALYAGTAQSIVSIWSRSDTYAHGFMIVPISLWLVWRKRDVLSGLPVAPWWPGTVVLAGLGAVWLLGQLATVQVVQQFAFVAMIPATVLVILGPGLARTVTFPLAFLLLGVPFGESFIVPLANFTADFTVAGVRLAGIPVLRNGNSFDIPTGSWSVVEACSGLRYLIASVTLGCLYAYLNFRTGWKRIAFILFSIAVPILANGIRAWLIVLIGHYSGNKLAVGVDHLVYGWVFFGMVMFVMFWTGSFWREDTAPALPAPGALERATRTRVPAGVFLSAVVAVAIVAAWPLYAHMVARRPGQDGALHLSHYAPAWQRAAAFSDWAPAYQQPAAQHRGYYMREGKPIGLLVMAYGIDAQKTQLISSSNQLLALEAARWTLMETRVQREAVAGQEIAVREAVIRDGHQTLLVWYTYWIDGRFTASDYVGKLLQARQKLLMRGTGNAAVFLFAPIADNRDEGRMAMRRFLADNLDTLQTRLAGEGHR